jgi:xanthine dehydrogenase small subunit
LLPIADINGKHLVSIEGLNGKCLNYIQEQMVDEGGTQCGFCTPGFIISLTNYFINHQNYSVDNAVSALDGNICRCTGYAGIKRAVANTINFIGDKITEKDSVTFLVKQNLLPSYFLEIPKKLKELHKFVHEKESRTKKGDLISGGTDLYVQKWEDLYESENVFIARNNKLKNIIKKGSKIYIGGAVTVSELCDSSLVKKHFPSLSENLRLFGSLPIRNRATIAGNIVNASPIGDITNILLALNATVHLRNKNIRRAVSLDEFYTGYKKLNKKKEEIVEEISFQIPPRNFYFNYEKVSRRKHLDIASVNSSIMILMQNGKVKQSRLSAGGVAPIPLYLKLTSEYLLNKKVDFVVLRETLKIAKCEIAPISDARGSKEYKATLLMQLIKAHFLKFFPEISIDEVLI